MKSAFAIVGLVLVLWLTGCQRMGWVQFVTNQAKQEELVAGVAALAGELGLRQDEQKPPVAGVLAVFANGDRTYSLIGVRQVKGDLVVDVIFRSYGKSDKVYEAAVQRVRELLRENCGPNFTERSSAKDRELLIPIKG